MPPTKTQPVQAKTDAEFIAESNAIDRLNDILRECDFTAFAIHNIHDAIRDAGLSLKLAKD